MPAWDSTGAAWSLVTMHHLNAAACADRPRRRHFNFNTNTDVPMCRMSPSDAHGYPGGDGCGGFRRPSWPAWNPMVLVAVQY